MQKTLLDTALTFRPTSAALFPIIFCYQRITRDRAALTVTQADRPAGKVILEDRDLLGDLNVEASHVVRDVFCHWSIRERRAVRRHACATVEVGNFLPVASHSIAQRVMNTAFGSHHKPSIPHTLNIRSIL